MPVLHPAEPWRRTGRYAIDELFKLKDRKGADMVLAMTHEEIVTIHVASAVRSYRDLPLILYHFQIKERDEPRPRAGVLRTREFIMKDSYTFDRDRGGARRLIRQARRRLRPDDGPCGLEWYRVESDVGMMGGLGAHEYMAPCAAGENEVALAPGLCRQRRGGERRGPAGRAARRRSPRRRRSQHPRADDGRSGGARARGSRRRAAEGLSGDARRRCDEARDGARRSPGQRDQARARARQRVSRRPPDEVARANRAAWVHRPGRRELPILLDEAVDPAATSPAPTSPTRTCAVSSPGAISPSSASTCERSWPGTRSAARRSGSSPRSRSATSSSSGRATPSRSAPGTSTSPARSSSSGWGPTDSGLRAPRQRRSSSTPTSTGSRGRGRSRRSTSSSSCSASREGEERSSPIGSTTSCAERACDTLYDDRDAGPGEKFADAELLGCPLRVTVGRRTLAAGEMEVQVRRGCESRTVPIDGAAQAIAGLWRSCPEPARAAVR